MLIVEMMKIQARIKKKIKIFHKPTKQRSIVLTFYDISLQIFFYMCICIYWGFAGGTPVFSRLESQGRRRAAIYGVAQSRTQLKQHSSSSSGWC